MCVPRSHMHQQLCQPTPSHRSKLWLGCGESLRDCHPRVRERASKSAPAMADPAVPLPEPVGLETPSMKQARLRWEERQRKRRAAAAAAETGSTEGGTATTRLSSTSLVLDTTLTTPSMGKHPYSTCLVVCSFECRCELKFSRYQHPSPSPPPALARETRRLVTNKCSLSQLPYYSEHRGGGGVQQEQNVRFRTIKSKSTFCLASIRFLVVDDEFFPRTGT